MVRIIIIILIASFFCNNSYSQKKVIIDSGYIDQRIPAQSKIDKFIGTKDFQYDEAVVPISWWDKLMHRIARSLFDPTVSAIIEYSIYAILIAAIIFIIHKLFVKDLFSMFFSEHRRKKTDYTLENEDITKLNFDQLIKNAETEKNLRLAVRYLFLKTLLALNHSGYIDWQITKTNHDYMFEINHKHIRTDFSGLVKVFDFIWYGNFQVSGFAYNQLKSDFITFYNLINKAA